jgi:hypothetical protein
VRHLAVIVTVFALTAAGCGHSTDRVFAPREVKAALKAEHLEPDRFVITLGGNPSAQTVPFDAAVQQTADDAAPLAMFTVLHTRAVVYVYASVAAAHRWGDLYPTRVLRVGNIVVLSAEGTPPLRQLHQALSRLH